MTIPSVDTTTLTNLSPNLDIGDVADPALRLAAFQYIYAELAVIVSEINSMPTANLQNLSVTTAKIAELAVTAAKLADGSVTTAKIAESAVTLAKMADSSVGTTELVNGAVTNAKVADATLTAAKFVAGALTNDTENALRITALQAETVTGIVNAVTGHGADPTGVTDSTDAIIAAIAATPYNGMLYIPRGTYKISDTITVNTDINFICDGDMLYYGPRDRAAFHFNRQVGKRIEFNNRVSDQIYTWHGWSSEAYTGIIFENSFRCTVMVNLVQNFTVGIRCLTSSGINFGFFFNTFNIMQLLDNKIYLEIYQQDSGSWFNSNVFNYMFFSLSQVGTEFQNAAVDRYCIKQTLVDNEYPSDSNIFHDIRFDIGSPLGGTYTGIYLQRAWGWTFDKYRIELVGDTNLKFCNLDLALDDMKGMVFNPAFETYTAPANVAVNLLNATQSAKPYTEIFTKTGVNPNNDFTLLYEDNNWNERYRKTTSDFMHVDRLYRYLVDEITLTTTSETQSEFGTSDALIENGVAINVFYSGVLYLKNVNVGDSIKVVLTTAVVPGALNISLKPFDASNVLIDGNLISGSAAISAGNSFWDVTNKRITQSNESNTLTFTINHADVETVAILFSGGLNGIKILTTNNTNAIKRSIDTNRNNFPHHVLEVAPTLKTDGKFLAGDIVYNSNTASGQVISWELKDNAGTLTWVSLGVY